jgi:hypothetical protein
VREAKSWNFLAFDLGMDSRSTGYKIARIKSKIGKAENPTVISGQEEDRQRILARSQSKKVWHKIFRGPLQKGQIQAFASTKETKRPMWPIEGRIFQATFQRRCLSLAWIFNPQSLCQVYEERGETLPSKDRETSLTDFTKKILVIEGAQIQRSKPKDRGRCMLRMHWTDWESKISSKSNLFHTLILGKIKSVTQNQGWSTKLGFNIGMKSSIKGTQGISQIETFKPLEIEIQAPC